jgi:two-component system, OmpR family, sensor histidine kinase KdpD
MRASTATAVEIVVSIAGASLLVLALKGVTPVTGLAVLYLPAVLVVAIRRGQVPGLVTAVLSVIALNFFFIEPRYQLTVAKSDQAVALGVFLIVAVVVGRLAATARERAQESDVRAAIADAREREAILLAEAASTMLVGGTLEGELETIGRRLSKAVGGRTRIELTAAPTPGPRERVVRLPLRRQSCWLYADEAADMEVLERIAEPLARLFDVAIERRKMREREAEAEAMVRAEGAKTAVLHTVSHDLRSPLTAIVTAASALRSGGLSQDDRTELLSVLDSETHRLTRLVDDLLDLSRIEAGGVSPRAEWCDLRDAVVSAAAQVRTAHGDHPIEIRLPDDLPLVRADAAQMERVFFNLIENAVKFSPSDAPVEVTGGAAPAGVTVRVKDRGPGVPASRRLNVFEPFFQGRSGDSGSGLGLAICRGFVEANGGRIALQSRRREGTAFAVTIPLAERAPAPA